MMAGATRDSDTRERKRGRRRAVFASIVLVGALVGVAGGWWIGGQRSSGFVSTATLRIKPLVGNAFSEDSSDALVSLETEAELVRSDRVLQTLANSDEGPADLNSLRRRTSASVVEGSEVILVAYRDDDTAVSERLVGVLANSVLEVREQQASDALEAQISLVSASRDDVQREIAEAQRPTVERVLNQRLAVLDDQLAALNGESLSPGEVIGVRTVRASRRALRGGMVLAGAAVGVVVALLVARRVAH